MRYRFSVGVDGPAASGAKVRSSKPELETVHDRDYAHCHRHVQVGVYTAWG
jgi:hypothetical protein